MIRIVEKAPLEERAMILQGGGSLGAYEAGAYKVAHQFIKYRNEKAGTKTRPIFEIIAGTSIGAINSAIITSYVVENKTWEGSAEHLIDFWNYLSTESISDRCSNYYVDWWDYWKRFFSNIASGETARRYYSSKEFSTSGVSKVFSNPNLVPDARFLDPFNIWFRYDSNPLKQSLEKFAKFPIATTHEENQPRLLLVSTDVIEGVPVVFDSYPKGDGTRHSGYGKFVVESNGKEDKKSSDKGPTGFEHVIRYDQGITSDHVIASCSVPIYFDYVKLEAERYDPTLKKYKKEERFFWDGGILINTPLMQVISSQRQYWYYGKKVKTDMPKLTIFQVNLQPSRINDVPFDHDGVKNRTSDIIFGDRTKNDETVILLFQAFQGLARKIIDISKDNGKNQKIIEDLLDQPIPTQTRFVGSMTTTYRDLIEGPFNLGEVIRVERKHDESSISNKIFDFTSKTINRLLQDGFDDTANYIKTQFGLKIFEESGLPKSNN